ncbi:MAG: hypothetical protein ABSF00_13545, partial [Candidatus Bathyarchaeia archaeon]
MQALSKELNPDLKQLTQAWAFSGLIGGEIITELSMQPLSSALSTPTSGNWTTTPNDFINYSSSGRLDHYRRNETWRGLRNNNSSLPLPTHEIYRTTHWIWFADRWTYAHYKQYIDPLLNWPEQSYTQISQWLGLTLPPGQFDGGRRAIYVDPNPGYYAWSCEGNEAIGYQVFKDIPDWPYVVIPHEMTNVFTGTVTGGWPTDWWADGNSPFPAMVAVQVEKQYNIPYWSQHDAGDSNSPAYVMFRDKLQGTYGWALFQNSFAAMMRDGVNLNQWNSEYESANWMSLHYIKSSIVAYYLSQAAGIDLSATLNQGSVGMPPPGWQGSYTPYKINLSALIPKTPTIEAPSGVQQGIIHFTVTSSDEWGIKSVMLWYSADNTTFTPIGTLTGGQKSAVWNSTQYVQGLQKIWFKAVAQDNFNFLSPQSVAGPLTVDNNAYVQVTVASNPTGVGYVTVDGMPVSSPHAYTWIAGSNHTIAASSAVQCANCQYVWVSWSDSGNQTHVIYAPSKSVTVTANFKKQFFLNMNSNPTAVGATTPTSGWQDAGSAVAIQATASTGHAFSSWAGLGSGSYTGTNNASKLIINGPITETARFFTLPSNSTTATTSTHTSISTATSTSSTAVVTTSRVTTITNSTNSTATVSSASTSSVTHSTSSMKSSTSTVSTSTSSSTVVVTTSTPTASSLLSVNPVSPPTPANGAASNSLPVNLVVQVTQNSAAVQGAIVTVYVDGGRAPGCLGVTDANGKYVCTYTPTLIGHTYRWYATASKSDETATSPIWAFSRNTSTTPPSTTTTASSSTSITATSSTSSSISSATSISSTVVVTTSTPTASSLLSVNPVSPPTPANGAASNSLPVNLV